jgi:hypothetical protein
MSTIWYRLMSFTAQRSLNQESPPIRYFHNPSNRRPATRV